MNKTLSVFISTFASVAAMTTTHAETFSFDRDAPGALPAGWRAGVTGRGTPKWSVEADATAPSKPNVLKQSGSGFFPWCVRPEVSLENNVSLYYTTKGRRNTLKYVDAPVPGNTWHTLRVEFAGNRIRVIFDGKPYIEMDDDHIAGPGAAGVWTKADSVTLFDDFGYGAASAR